MGDIVVEAPRVVLGTQKHTNITTMIKAMMEVVGGFCESQRSGLSAAAVGWRPVRRQSPGGLPTEKLCNSSTKGNQVKRE